jgi:aminoglycoside phosphotransferase (APT) family kinase protein
VSDVLDQATPLDAHDAVPLDRLAPWLAATLGVDASTLELGRFGRGFSNLTFLIRAGGRELVLRRPPPGVKIASAHDMTREARILQGVRRVWDKVPEVVAICEDPDVLGAPFFVMERVPGVILRDRKPQGLALGEDVLRRLSTAMVDTLAEIHGLDLDRAGLADLGKAEGYVARQVEGWSRRYDDARTEDVDDMAWLAAWLRAHQPPQAGAVLVHNDFKYDNVLLDPADPTRVIAVLDWEMATRGDPLLDLGTFLAYWVQADDPPGMQVFRLCLTDLPGNLTRGGLVERYAAVTGRSFDPTWYFTFGLFKNAVVAQQLHARYVRGLTREERYAHLNWAVRGIAGVARQAATEGRIEGLGG